MRSQESVVVDDDKHRVGWSSSFHEFRKRQCWNKRQDNVIDHAIAMRVEELVREVTAL
jgi:hypothetical protein